MELDQLQSIFEVLSPVSRGPFQLLSGQQLQLWRRKCCFLADNASSLIDDGETYLHALLAPIGELYIFFSVMDLTESRLPPSHASCNRVKPFLIIRFKTFQQDTQQDPNVPQHAECRGVQLYLSTTTLKSFFSTRFFIVYISCFSQA